MNNSEKGHQGFTSKYKTLGKTENIRIPVSIKDEIEILVRKLDTISYHKGKDKANKILDSIIKKLDKK